MSENFYKFIFSDHSFNRYGNHILHKKEENTFYDIKNVLRYIYQGDKLCILSVPDKTAYLRKFRSGYIADKIRVDRIIKINVIDLIILGADPITPYFTHFFPSIIEYIIINNESVQLRVILENYYMGADHIIFDYFRLAIENDNVNILNILFKSLKFKDPEYYSFIMKRAVKKNNPEITKLISQILPDILHN